MPTGEPKAEYRFGLRNALPVEEPLARASRSPKIHFDD
jgi:hypothetical protein